MSRKASAKQSRPNSQTEEQVKNINQTGFIPVTVHENIEQTYSVYLSNLRGFIVKQ